MEKKYIDTEDFKKSILHAAMTEDDKIALFRRVNSIPAADVAPVRHGKWKEQDVGDGDIVFVCSICGETWTLLAGTPQENNMNYCPLCGGKMDAD